MKRWSRRTLRAAATFAALAAANGSPAQAQEPALDWDNYEKVTLSTSLGEPIDLAVLPDRRVLTTARDGAVRLVDPATGTTKVINQLNVYTTGEMGLQTVTLDPDFATNKWVYLYYAPIAMEAPFPPSTPSGNAPGTLPAGETEAYWDRWKGYNQLSRFKWSEATSSLDLATEQKIIKVPTNRGQCCHQGGDVAFDAAGNLYLSTGDNTPSGAGGSGGYSPINDTPGTNPGNDSRRGAGNTNDLRGKILRIRVGADGTYTIPAGNLFAPGTMGTKPEIYIMGVRNPFRISVDQQSGTLIWGDYGPDAGRADPQRGPMGYVEWNAVPTVGGAGNSGWPYCTGDNTQPYNDWNWDTATPGAFFDCGRIKNDSRHNTGLTDLPPAVPADLWYGDRNCYAGQECDQPWPELTSFSENIEQAPMPGPIYRYDAANPSDTKWPSYWNAKAFFGEYSQDYLAAFSFAAPDGAVTKIENVFPNLELGRLGYQLWDGVIDLEFGPDGSLYVLNHDTVHLARIDYSPGNKRPRPSITADRTSGGAAPLEVTFDGSASNDPDGDAITYQWDFTGDGTWDSTAVKPSYSYTANGLYAARLQVTDSKGKATVTSLNISVGNTAPTVKLIAPANGAFTDWGRAVIYQVQVMDDEDTGAITCNRVRYTVLLGHATHAHPYATGVGCKFGVPIFPNAPAEHGVTENLYTVIDVAYTDAGANGVPGATGTTRVILNPKLMEAEHADASSGTTVGDDPTASGTRTVTSFDPGDWLAYDPVNFTNLTSVTTRASGSGTLALRWNSPTARPFQTITLPAGSGYRTVTTALASVVGLPTDSGRLYVTSESGSVVLDSFAFSGDGVTDVIPPTVTAVWNPAQPTGENGWYVTNPTLTMAPVDNGSIYAREYSYDNGVTWQQNSYADQGDSGRELGNTLVVDVPGERDVLYRVWDTSFNISAPGRIHVKIDRTAPTIVLDGLVDGKVATPVTIRATDFMPGSGGATITSVTLDGTAVALDKLRAAQLTVGTHVVVVKARDIAGNTGTRTETFTVTGAVQDLDVVTAPGTVGGTVPATLALTLGAPASFGPFTPGVAKDYLASTTAGITSSAGDATLTVSDPGATAPGRLVNGAFSLLNPLTVRANGAGEYAALTAPVTLARYTEPLANRAATVEFKQSVGAAEALRTGTYSKTLTFSLSTTAP